MTKYKVCNMLKIIQLLILCLTLTRQNVNLYIVLKFLRMLGEHAMMVNFSYRAIPNLTLDLNGGHFSKWPPEHTCINIPVP